MQNIFILSCLVAYMKNEKLVLVLKTAKYMHSHPINHRQSPKNQDGKTKMATTATQKPKPKTPKIRTHNPKSKPSKIWPNQLHQPPKIPNQKAKPMNQDQSSCLVCKVFTDSRLKYAHLLNLYNGPTNTWNSQPSHTGASHMQHRQNQVTNGSNSIK